MAERALNEKPTGDGRRSDRVAAGLPLGERLRQERHQQGLGLRELARRLDVSPSLVSQIETGRAQPSVRTLYAMVSELGISLDAVFSDAPRRHSALPTERARDGVEAADAESEATRPSGLVQRAHDRRGIELESGVRWERLTTWNDPDVDFLYAVYEAGGASSTDGARVRHNGREFGIVLSGRLNVDVGFDECVLEPGDSISFDSSVPHRLHNDEDEVVHAIWLVIGRHRQQATDS